LEALLLHARGGGLLDQDVLRLRLVLHVLGRDVAAVESRHVLVQRRILVAELLLLTPTEDTADGATSREGETENGRGGKDRDRAEGAHEIPDWRAVAVSAGLSHPQLCRVFSVRHPSKG